MAMLAARTEQQGNSSRSTPLNVIPFPPYDISLRDISEFLRTKREELDELERQKQQIELMMEMAGRAEKAARMASWKKKEGGRK